MWESLKGILLFYLATNFCKIALCSERVNKNVDSFVNSSLRVISDLKGAITRTNVAVEQILSRSRFLDRMSSENEKEIVLLESQLHQEGDAFFAENLDFGEGGFVGDDETDETFFDTSPLKKRMKYMFLKIGQPVVKDAVIVPGIEREIDRSGFKGLLNVSVSEETPHIDPFVEPEPENVHPLYLADDIEGKSTSLPAHSTYISPVEHDIHSTSRSFDNFLEKEYTTKQKETNSNKTAAKGVISDSEEDLPDTTVSKNLILLDNNLSHKNIFKSFRNLIGIEKAHKNPDMYSNESFEGKGKDHPAKPSQDERVFQKSEQPKIIETFDKRAFHNSSNNIKGLDEHELNNEIFSNVGAQQIQNFPKKSTVYKKSRGQTTTKSSATTLKYNFQMESNQEKTGESGGKIRVKTTAKSETDSVSSTTPSPGSSSPGTVWWRRYIFVKSKQDDTTGMAVAGSTCKSPRSGAAKMGTTEKTTSIDWWWRGGDTVKNNKNPNNSDKQVVNKKPLDTSSATVSRLSTVAPLGKLMELTTHNFWWRGSIGDVKVQQNTKLEVASNKPDEETAGLSSSARSHDWWRGSIVTEGKRVKGNDNKNQDIFENKTINGTDQPVSSISTITTLPSNWRNEAIDGNISDNSELVANESHKHHSSTPDPRHRSKNTTSNYWWRGSIVGIDKSAPKISNTSIPEDAKNIIENSNANMQPSRTVSLWKKEKIKNPSYWLKGSKVKGDRATRNVSSKLEIGNATNIAINSKLISFNSNPSTTDILIEKNKTTRDNLWKGSIVGNYKASRNVSNDTSLETNTEATTNKPIHWKRSTTEHTQRKLTSEHGWKDYWWRINGENKEERNVSSKSENQDRRNMFADSKPADSDQLTSKTHRSEKTGETSTNECWWRGSLVGVYNSTNNSANGTKVTKSRDYSKQYDRDLTTTMDSIGIPPGPNVWWKGPIRKDHEEQDIRNQHDSKSTLPSNSPTSASSSAHFREYLPNATSIYPQ